MKNIVRLSVHQLVDFLLRSGDIDTRVFNQTSMTEGTLLHALYQSKQSDNYLSEYPLSVSIEHDNVTFIIEGRADGIIKKSETDFIIDEIKTTVIDLEKFKNENEAWHLGQASCYAYMFLKEKNLKQIGVRLTYIKQGNIKEKLIQNYSFLIDELEQYIHGLLDDYLAFYRIIEEKRIKRNQTIKELKFPFKEYRKGQRELAKYAYSISKKGGRLFVEAPTGIGKTMSTLYPFIKSLVDDESSKIFYLTAKSSGKENAHKAYRILKEKGLLLGSIVITSKEKICFCKDKACNPDECPYAKGYYSKIQTVLRNCLMEENDFSFENITKYALENEICPFEFELDLSLFLDLIICDYNYMFDPVSYMKRYFDEDSSHFLALIDEAHNLVDRSKDMYSAGICEDGFKAAKFGQKHIKNTRIKRALNKIKIVFDYLSQKLEDKNQLIIDEIMPEHIACLESFTKVISEESKEHNKEVSSKLVDFYLDVNRFLRIYELTSRSSYLFYINRVNEHDIQLKQLCLNPSIFLKSITNRIKASIFFSATFSPSDYYMDLLGGDKNLDPVIHLPSPFPINNLRLMVAPKISVKYKNRESSYKDVANYIEAFVSRKVGNYLIYLPSYEYLEKLKTFITLKDSVETFYQNKDMTETEKEDFLLHFISNPKKTTIGFVIIGGSFAEGIDLVGDRLLGVLIVGIGLSKINFESDQISKFYSENNLNGYDYAYIYPGMNKVMQAVGRVIRSEKDKGVVLLLDERYVTNQYQDLFRSEWRNYQVVFNKDEVKEQLTDFFIK